MFASLVAVVRLLRRSWLIESAGAALIVAGVYLAWGVSWALIGSGVALVLKAFEIESSGR